MANAAHVEVLDYGVSAWNDWLEARRKAEPNFSPDLSSARLAGRRLRKVNFADTNLCGAELVRADLADADLREANLCEANLSDANLLGTHLELANLIGARLDSADLTLAHLAKANLTAADLTGATLTGADLQQANLRGARLLGAVLVKANLTGADLTGCWVYGVSAWDVNLTGTTQKSLAVNLAPDRADVITVDNLAVAQFIYLLLSNQTLREVLDAATSKVILILGRFTPERKAVLYALRDSLRQHNYLPVLFEFERPAGRDLTETVSALAHLAHFIVADISDPMSIQHELGAFVPNLAVPVQPIIESGQRSWSMFQDLRKHDWMLPIYEYTDCESLIACVEAAIIAPAEAKAKDLATRKAERWT